MPDEQTRIHAVAYSQFWLGPVPEPPSAKYLEAISNFFHVPWRPEKSKDKGDNNLILVDRNKALDADHYYERLIPDYISSSPQNPLDISIEKSQRLEICHRIFKSIYMGNFFDDLMPIETRHYTTTADRVGKVFLSAVLTLTLFILAYLIPAGIYNRLWDDQALLRIGSDHLTTYVIDNNIYSDFLTSVSSSSGFPDVRKYEPFTKIAPARAYKDDIYNFVKTHVTDLAGISSLNIWQAATPDDKIKSVTEAIFLNSAILNESLHHLLTNQYHIVTTPMSNLFELLSQMFFSIYCLLLVNYFLSVKSEFYSVFEKIDKLYWPNAIVSLQEILASNFFLRKKYHYLLSLIVTSIVLLLKYIFTDIYYSTYTRPAAQVLGINSYDYRLFGDAIPVFALSWLVQFGIVYTFVLVCLELGILKQCLRIWQSTLLVIDVIKKDNFYNTFRDLWKSQNTRFWLMIIVLPVLQFFLSIFKLLEANVWINDVFGSVYINLLPIFSINWPVIIIHWNQLFSVYLFGPVASIAMIMYATWPCAKTAAEAEQYADNKLPDLEALIELVLEGVKQVSALSGWVDTVKKRGQSNHGGDEK